MCRMAWRSRRNWRAERRREFIPGVGGTAALPVVAWAQQPAMPVVGWLVSTSRDANMGRLAAFREGLSKPALSTRSSRAPASLLHWRQNTGARFGDRAPVRASVYPRG